MEDTPQSQNNGFDFDQKDDDASDDGEEGYEFDSNNPYSNFNSQQEEDHDRFSSEYDFGSVSEGIATNEDDTQNDDEDFKRSNTSPDMDEDNILSQSQIGADSLQSEKDF